MGSEFRNYTICTPHSNNEQVLAPHLVSHTQRHKIWPFNLVSGAQESDDVPINSIREPSQEEEEHWESNDGKAASNVPGSIDTPFGVPAHGAVVMPQDTWSVLEFL